MDNRPIGFFDSGLGGLTAIPGLFKELPDERVISQNNTNGTLKPCTRMKANGKKI